MNCLWEPQGRCFYFSPVLLPLCGGERLQDGPSDELHPDSVCENLAFKLNTSTEVDLVRLFFQFVADGIFKAELNEFLTRELAEDGYSGVEVRVTPTRTEIIILATR